MTPAYLGTAPPMTPHITAVAAASDGSGSDLVALIVTGLLSGSLFAALGALVTGRAMARKTHSEGRAIDAKLPAEVDSVVVQGAEAAVLTMQAALNSATGRITQLEAERASDRQVIADLEKRLEQYRRKVEAAERALVSAREAGAALRVELEQFVAQQGRRK